jgi:hypothetical protein
MFIGVIPGCSDLLWVTMTTVCHFAFKRHDAKAMDGVLMVAHPIKPPAARISSS